MSEKGASERKEQQQTAAGDSTVSQARSDRCLFPVPFGNGDDARQEEVDGVGELW